jgi:DNA polymerase III subunit beta
MKLTATKNNLRRAIALASHVVSKNINLPILNNILFKAENGLVVLSATNLEIGITSFLRGKIESDGVLTVDAKVISEYVSFLPDENVDLDLVADNLSIKCGNYKTKIKTQSAQDFPLIPVLNKDNYYELDGEVLRNSLPEVLIAVSGNETRAELSGVLFVFGKDELVLAGTDSYRLAEKKIKCTAFGCDTAQAIVPAKTLQELVRIMAIIKEDQDISDNNKIKVCLSDNQILFIVGNTELVSRLISGHYPDYGQIVPQNIKTTVLANRTELLRAVKAAAIFSKTGINDIGLEYRTSGELIVSAVSGQVGESQIELSAEISGENGEVVINHRYLIDGLNSLSGETIKIELVSGQSPCILRSAKDTDYFYIVMPIRQ